MDILIPDIDSHVPIPAKAADAMPELSPVEELEMRARTVKLLSDLTGIPIVPTEEAKAQAVEVAKEMVSDPKMRPDYTKYPNEVMAYLAGMVTQMNRSLVDELADLKMYVVNKLIYEAEHATLSKDRISALTKIGEIDGVNAFKRHSEITHKILPIEEVEKELLSVLENIEYKVIDAQEPDIDDSDAEIQQIIADTVYDDTESDI